ncbi:MAG: hypothetical protein WBB74_07565 [Gaiellaceae bacterium]
MRKLTVAIAAIAAFSVAGVVTAAPPSLTLAASPTTVSYGATSTLSGTLSSHKSGQTVTVEGQECGKTAFAKVADVTTGANGVFSYPAKPTLNTMYRARAKSATSPTVQVSARPVLQLRRLAARKFSIAVNAAQSFVGKFVYLQRYRAGTKKWTNVSRVTLKTLKAGAAPTQISSAAFRVKVAARVKLRALLPRASAQPCYLDALSNTIRS